MKKSLTIAAALAIALMPNTACTNQDRSENVENVSSTNTSVLSSTKIQKTFDGISKIKSALKNDRALMTRIKSRMSKTAKGSQIQYVDQQTVDELKKIGGFKENISVDNVNAQITENMKARDIGYKEYINQSNVSSNAKVCAISLLDNPKSNMDITKTTEFAQMTINEQASIQNMSLLMNGIKTTPSSTGREAEDIIYDILGLGIGAFIGQFFGGSANDHELAAGIGALIGVIVALIIFK